MTYSHDPDQRMMTGTLDQAERRPAPARMNPPFEIVAIASSAGGVHALTDVLQRLPRDLPVIVVCVQHLDPRHRSLMPEIMRRRAKVPVDQAEHGIENQPSHVYLAPHDRHLLVNADRTISLTQTELYNFVRPSPDLMFESVASAF